MIDPAFAGFGFGVSRIQPFTQKYYTKVVDIAWLYPVAHHHGGLVAVI